MTRKKKGSRYDQVGRSGGTSSGGVDGGNVGLGGVQRGFDERGRVSLRVYWSTHSSVEVSEWLHYANIAEPFAWALLSLGKTLAPSSRYRASRDLSSGFFCFLRDSHIPRDISLNGITNEVVNSFISWLSQIEGDAPKYTWTSRSHRLGVLRRIVAALRRTKWGNQLAPRLRVRSNPWPSRSRNKKPVEVLSRPDWEALYRCCVEEMGKTVELYRNAQALMERDRERLPCQPKSRSEYKELGLCLAAIEAIRGTELLTREMLLRKNRSLSYAIDTYHGGIKGVGKYWYPSPRLLVPFVLYLAVHTIYNTDALLALERKDISEVSVLGMRRLRFRANKGRGKGKQARSFLIGSSLGPDVIVHFLEEWTAPIRPLVSARFADRLFIFVPLSRGPVKDADSSRARGFLTMGKEISSDVAWRESVKSFCKEHGLPYVRLSEVRKTGQDIVHDLFNGDLRVIQAASGHRNPQTFIDHYQSDAARKRNDERLAEVMATRQRWVETSGKIDPRRAPFKSDLGAATPGFSCLDPFASPISGEIPGRLCRSYGACPECPLASVDRTDAYALARLAQLKRKIEEAQHLMEAPRWLGAWAPRLAKLNHYWLPQFTDDAVIQKAAQLSLMQLPDLE